MPPIGVNLGWIRTITFNSFNYISMVTILHLPSNKIDVVGRYPRFTMLVLCYIYTYVRTYVHRYIHIYIYILMQIKLWIQISWFILKINYFCCHILSFVFTAQVRRLAMGRWSALRWRVRSPQLGWIRLKP